MFRALKLLKEAAKKTPTQMNSGLYYFNVADGAAVWEQSQEHSGLTPEASSVIPPTSPLPCLRPPRSCLVKTTVASHFLRAIKQEEEQDAALPVPGL